MPVICRFFGIIIAIYYNDHNPPHFHARYGEDSVIIRIEDFAVLEGYLPPRALGLVMEWADIHRDDLRNDWALASENMPLLQIEPLK
ncbi:MAG: DUF4160 domain-containing protein [Deltaproteobacteria bacterium]|nr:DUF4160 domain-containing protein [Deltaproteobacteria bacterium]